MKTLAKALTVDLAIVLLAFGLTSCVEPSPSRDLGMEEDHEHGGGAAVTIWTDNVELFFEYPPMVAGEPGEAWAIHLTFLEDFQPVREGKLTLRFVGPDRKEYKSVAETPARDGIFTPAPSLPSEGAYQLAMTLEGPRGEEAIPVGEIRVFGSSEELPHVDDAPAPGISFGISFLKEQQWSTPFAVAPAIELELERSISANGEIVPVPNAEAHVSAPFEGLVRAQHNLGAPSPGDWVQAGERIAVLSPIPGENAYAALRAKVERQEREVKRAERLSAVEAIPKRRLVEARHDLAVSRAALEAVGEVNGQGYELTLTAPISGVVTERNMTVGERVLAGARLFTIVDPKTLWLHLQIPARQAAIVSEVSSGSFTVEGSPRVYEGARLISVGAAIDPERRTLPVVLETRNRDGSLKVGMLVEARLFLAESVSGVAVPSRAVRKEDALDVAYVQVGGESFERRVLVLGPSDGEWTLVTSGILSGERVVTEGAYQVRLASLNTSEIADHGHAH